MAEGESMLARSNRGWTLRMTLENMGVVVNENEMAMSVLNDIPHRFLGLIGALDAVDGTEKTFTMAFIRSRLLQQEQLIQDWAAHAIIPDNYLALISWSYSPHSRPSCSCSSRRTTSDPARTFIVPGIRPSAASRRSCIGHRTITMIVICANPILQLLFPRTTPLMEQMQIRKTTSLFLRYLLLIYGDGPACMPH